MKKLLTLLLLMVLITGLNAQIVTQEKINAAANGISLSKPNLDGLTSNIGATLTSINTADYVVVGNTNITGTIKNSGANVIASFDVTYKIDGGTESAVYSVSGLNIAPSASYNFTHNLPAKLTVGQHNIELTISNVNGSNANVANNVLSRTVTVTSGTPTKRVFCEELTSVLCGYCVRGIVFMDSMIHTHPTDWVGVSCHSTGMGTDPMVCAAWDNGNKLFPNFSGYPSVIVDRTTLDDPSNLPADYATEKALVAPVDVAIENISYNSTNKLLTFEVQATSYTSGTVNWNINGGVYEMNVTYAQDPGVDSTEYQQHNYYASSDGYGLGAMGGFQNLPDPIPAAYMHYNYIARGILGGYSGTSGCIPSSVTDGATYTHSYDYLVTYNQNEPNFYLVGFVTDATSGKVLNSIQVPVTAAGIPENNSAGNIKMYPNPSKGIVNIKGLNNKSQITVTNLFGETLMYVENTNKIDMSNFANGVYFIKINSDNHIVTEKILLNK